jgi:hypothetical protein
MSFARPESSRPEASAVDVSIDLDPDPWTTWMREGSMPDESISSTTAGPDIWLGGTAERRFAPTDVSAARRPMNSRPSA